MASTTNLNLIPAATPPPGQQPHFVNPPNDNAPFIAWLAIYIVVSTPLVGMRVYTREFVTRQLWWDDWTCILGWAFLMALVGMQFRGLQLGGAADTWNVTKADRNEYEKLFKNEEIIARVGMFFTKASILLLLHRLFVPEGVRWTKVWWGIWLNIWWNLLYAIALILALLLDCVNNPLKKAQGKSCENQFAILIGASIINVVTDLAILVVPMLAIRGLQMSRTRKLKWAAAFAVGFAGVLASLARLIFQVIQAKNQTNLVLSLVMILASAEQIIGIFVPCLAAMPAFWRHVTGKQKNPTRERIDGRSTTWTLTGPSKKKRSGRKSKPADPYPIFTTMDNDTAYNDEPGDFGSQTQTTDNDTIYLMHGGQLKGVESGASLPPHAH